VGEYFEELMHGNIFSCFPQDLIVKYFWKFLLISFVVFLFLISFFAWEKILFIVTYHTWRYVLKV